MRGINKVILVGTLGRDPETKTFPNGGSLTQFSIATSESWIDKNTGERKEQTEWHRIVLYNRLGEIAQQYLKKGSKVYIQGKLRTRSWEDQNGQTRYTTEIVAEQMQMLDSNPNSGVQPPANFDPESFNGKPLDTDVKAPVAKAPTTRQKSNKAFVPSVPPADLDDDLPF